MKVLKTSLLLTAIFSGITLSACNSGSSSPSSGPSIQYKTLNYTGTLPAGGTTGLTGIRQQGSSSNVYISGSYAIESVNHGSLYVGPITGGGTYYIYDYPSSTNATTAATNIYSVDNGIGESVVLTGSYTTVESGSYNFGFLYNGPLGNNLVESASWITLDVPSLLNVASTYGTIPHSVMGNFVVGNYQSTANGSNGFIYNIANQSVESVTINHALYTSIYGIWANGGESYTIAGGYTNRLDGVLSVGFIADYESGVGISNVESYYYNNTQNSLLTHFEGITADGKGGYNLAGEGLVVESGESAILGVAFVNVPRNQNGTFGTAAWISAWYPNSASTTADTVYQNYLLGVYTLPNISQLNGYVATIPTSWY